MDTAKAAAPKKAKAVKAPVQPARAPRASAKAVTHKHKKATMAVPPAEPAAAVVTAPVAEPTYDQMAHLAYSYWEARGYQGGSEYEDWLRAVGELRSR